MTKANDFIAQIEKQLGEITPGKWEASDEIGNQMPYLLDNNLAILARFTNYAGCIDDAQFIAQSPETIRKLTAMLKVAMEALDKYTEGIGVEEEDISEVLSNGLALNGKTAKCAFQEIERIAAGGEHEQK